MRGLAALLIGVSILCFVAERALADVAVVRIRYEMDFEGQSSSSFDSGIVTLRNDGMENIDISEWMIANKNTRNFEIDNAQKILAPGETVDIKVRGNQKDIMTMFSPDNESPLFPGSSLGSGGSGNAFNIDQMIGNESNGSMSVPPPISSVPDSAFYFDSGDEMIEDESAIAVPEPANILMFVILAISGIAFAIWHRNSIKNSNA